VRDDFPLWSGRYDRELTDIFAIQDEISRGIANNLRLKLGRGRRRYETNLEAYEIYLRGRALENQTGLSGLLAGIRAFEQAIAKDPSLAPAYAGLANAHTWQSGFDRFDQAERAEQMSKLRAAAEKAIQLDPLLAEAHGALGNMYARNAQWQLSEKSFRLAVELGPSDSLTHLDFAMNVLYPLGRIEEALAEARLAEKSDPLSRHVQSMLRDVLAVAGREEELEIRCRKQPADEQEKSGCLARVLSRHGKFDEALRIEEATWRDRLSEPGASSLGVAYAKADRRQDAERVAAVVPRPLAQAAILAALGDKERTIDALERMAPLGPIRVGRTLLSHTFAFVRGDPRVKALRKKVGLPE
jgi:tetratricopeptide (TPR) repeat protein